MTKIKIPAKPLDPDTQAIYERISTSLKIENSDLSRRISKASTLKIALNLRCLEFLNASLDAYRQGIIKKSW